MTKKKNNFFASLGIIFIIAVAFYFLLNKASKDDNQITTENITQIKEETQRSPTSVVIKNKTKEETAEENKRLSSKIVSYVPTFAPSELKQRWTHVINSEDDLYLDTQLNLDNIPLETFNYRWKKDFGGTEGSGC
jgi:hypothetical protein